MKLNEEQIEWLNKCTKGTWSLNSETGLVDVNGEFNCREQKLKDFKGVRFGVITEGFNCYNNSLTTLEGAPQEVGGNFFCNRNSLTTLEGAPQKVGGHFACDNNSLTKLEGAPQEVGECFLSGGNPIPHNILIGIWSIMKNKKVPYIIALGIYKKEVKEAIDPRLTEGISEETLKGASLLGRILS